MAEFTQFELNLFEETHVHLEDYVHFKQVTAAKWQHELDWIDYQEAHLVSWSGEEDDPEIVVVRDHYSERVIAVRINKIQHMQLIQPICFLNDEFFCENKETAFYEYH